MSCFTHDSHICCDDRGQNDGEEGFELPDHTLASCCERDLKEQRYIAQAKAKLLSVDRVDKRTREANSVLSRTRPPDTCDTDSLPKPGSEVSDSQGETLL